MKYRKWNSRTGKDEEVDVPVGRWTAMTLGILLLLVVISVASASGCKEYGRWQKRADAKNRTSVVRQEIKTAQQQALVVNAQIQATKARAQMRYQESVGIRRAQDEIAATLTGPYLQHEMIEALRTSRAPVVYLPSGNMGVPLVNDVSQHGPK